MSELIIFGMWNQQTGELIGPFYGGDIEGTQKNSVLTRMNGWNTPNLVLETVPNLFAPPLRGGELVTHVRLAAPELDVEIFIEGATQISQTIERIKRAIRLRAKVIFTMDYPMLSKNETLIGYITSIGNPRRIDEANAFIEFSAFITEGQVS